MSFRERGREGEREGEKHQCVVVPPAGDLVSNPGMCPDWESNQRPFGSQASTQSTEPHQRGPGNFLKVQWIPMCQQGMSKIHCDMRKLFVRPCVKKLFCLTIEKGL